MIPRKPDLYGDTMTVENSDVVADSDQIRIIKVRCVGNDLCSW